MDKSAFEMFLDLRRYLLKVELMVRHSYVVIVVKAKLVQVEKLYEKCPHKSYLFANSKCECAGSLLSYYCSNNLAVLNPGG